MLVGVPREIKVGERRVALTPAGAAALAARNVPVLIEHGAGDGSGFMDDQYRAVGATLADRATVFRDSTLIVKVKEPVADEPDLLHAGQTLFCYLHLAAMPELAHRLVGHGLIAIAYETVALPDGSLPLLAPMSIVAGRLAVQVGAALLQSDHGGRGVLLGGVPGVAPGTVVVLGAGTVGRHAIQMAVGLGARVTALNRGVAALADLDHVYAGRVETLVANPDAIARAVREADLLVGAVLVPGARAPALVSRAMVAAMAPGSVIVDVAVDQGGCVATIRPTTHEAPTYVDEGVIHYGVTNMPALAPRTATLALTNATLPYLLALATRGVPVALRADPALARGLTIWDHCMPYTATAEALGLPHADVATVLAGAPPFAMMHH